MQARVRVLDEQEHRLLRRACSDVVAVLLSEVVGAEVEAEVDAQVRAQRRGSCEKKKITPTQYYRYYTYERWRHPSTTGRLGLS